MPARYQGFQVGEYYLVYHRHRLQRSYAQALNKRCKRNGPLFNNRERFQHKHVYNERYQVLLCRNIHVNPLKDGLVQRLKNWAFSRISDLSKLGEGTEEDKELEGWLNLQ